MTAGPDATAPSGAEPSRPMVDARRERPNGETQMKLTIVLWVQNQPDGIGTDATAAYIAESGWTCPAGVTYDRRQCTLTGDGPDVWEAFAALRKQVADGGHGADCDELPAPELTCVPVDRQIGTAAEAMIRVASLEAKTWEEFASKTRVPIEISRNGEWVGNGYLLADGSIESPARLGEEVYDALEEALQEDEWDVEIDGVTYSVTNGG